MAIIYRVIRQKYASQPLSVEGTRLYGGRWNPPGVGLLYTAEHPALALVEILVHAPRVPYAELPAYRLFTLDIPDQSQRVVTANELPSVWREKNYAQSQTVLSNWLTSPDVLALGVPSSVMPSGINYLLHAGHPDFAQIRVVGEEPLIIDSRLWPL